MAYRWRQLFGVAARSAGGHNGRFALAGAAVAVSSAGAAAHFSGFGEPRRLVRMETLEERIRKVEAKIALMQLDSEEVRAVEILMKDAKAHGLDISGGKVRRTSSRFCLGVEHGDYNGTELFGVGTDRFIWMAYKPNNRGKIRVYSHNCADEGVIEFMPGRVPEPQSAKLGDTWARFPFGVEHVLRKNGFDTSEGFDAVIVGNIPGGGMSRSASLTINLLLTMLELNECSMPEGDFRHIELAQAVENDYIGTPCGNLDQIMIYYAKAGMATRFNPASKKVTYVPLGLNADHFRIAALDTGTVRDGLEKSTYAVRVKECQALVKKLQERGYAVESLGDVREHDTYDRIMAEFGASEPEMCKRLQYIFFAQKRFEAMIAAWEQGDIKEVGNIFRRDGIGLRDEYNISGRELETMVDVARTVPGVLGERMLGGGDKGAAGAILHTDAEGPLRTAVDMGYKRSHPDYQDKCAVHVVKVCQGVDVMEGLV
eukprot:TRINITY_DN19871_c0_g1_i1.p1 TRINITY_DN19871_c0_g1~~TRINITY_DN19871_c0_g1_i1.p1  ORF type:complete len:515 (-),score=95.50 TRINITY_DN19871_c0_g1_i1:42-1496(-)